MKKSTFLLVAVLLAYICVPFTVLADSTINLTPVPKSMKKGSGSLTLPASFDIYTGGVSDEMAAEAAKFATVIN